MKNIEHNISWWYRAFFLWVTPCPFFNHYDAKKKTFPGIKANQNKHNIKPNLDEMQEWDSDCEQVKSRKKDIEWALYLSLLQHTQNELKQNQEITGSTYPLLYWFFFHNLCFIQVLFFASTLRLILFEREILRPFRTVKQFFFLQKQRIKYH